MERNYAEDYSPRRCCADARAANNPGFVPGLRSGRAGMGLGGMDGALPSGRRWDVDRSPADKAGLDSRADSTSGMGEITMIPVMLAWKADSWQCSAFPPTYAPAGDYEKNQLANPGLNYWTFDPTVGVQYNNDKTVFNAARFSTASLAGPHHPSISLKGIIA